MGNSKVTVTVFYPCNSGQWSPTLNDFHPRFDPLLILSYLYSWERASISLTIFYLFQSQAKKGFMEEREKKSKETGAGTREG